MSRHARKPVRWFVPLLIAAAAPPAAAQITYKQPTDCEREKLFDVAILLSQVWKSMASMSILDLVGGGGMMPVEYEKVTKDGVEHDPTFEDVADHIYDMINHGMRKVLKGALNRANGQVIPADGLKSDRIVINEKLLKDLCDPTVSAEKKMKKKMQLLATLANEATHVFQKLKGATDKQVCDAEGDSDLFSNKAMNGMLAAFSDANGNPHTTIAAVLADPQYPAGLKDCLTMAGATDADIPKIQAFLKGRAAFYISRWLTFQSFGGAGASWASWYHGGHDDDPVGAPDEDESLRDRTIMTGSDTVSTRTFFVAPGELVVSRAFESADGRIMLASATRTMWGNRSITLWRDNNNDGLPELPPLAVVNLPLGSMATSAIYSMQVIASMPPVLHSGLVPDGLVIVDRNDGSVMTVELNPDGSPNGIQNLIVQDPLIATAAYGFLVHWVNPDPPASFARLIFSDSNFGASPVIWFDAFPGFVLPSTGPGLTFQQAVAPDNLVGIETVRASAAGPVTLHANPFENVSLTSVGKGSAAFVASGVTDASGTTAPLAASVPLQGSDLLSVQGGIPPSCVELLPRRGHALTRIETDETLDGIADRLDLSRSPLRLHFFSGLGAGVYRHDYEMLIENSDARVFRSWSDGAGRRIGGADNPILFQRIPAHMPVLYTQSLHDFDNDTAPNEAMVIARLDPGPPNFLAFCFTQLNTPLPTPPQVLQLPLGFDPGAITYTDFNGDNRLDVRLSSFDGAADVCIINSANPPPNRFSVGSCAVAPVCCLGNADKITPGSVSFADVTAVLVNFGANYGPGNTGPGDANCSSGVSFVDVTSVLVNFGAACP